VIVFLCGAIVLSFVVLWRKQCWFVYLLGLLFWAMVCSVVTMLSVIDCAFYLNGGPCPLMHVLSYPVSIQLFLIIYRWCPNCLGFQLQFWLGGLYWEVESPALTGSFAQANWLTETLFPLFQLVTMVEALIVFIIVWSLRFIVSWLKIAIVPASERKEVVFSFP
jgi:hypothetical protein